VFWPGVNDLTDFLDEAENIIIEPTKAKTLAEHF